MAVSRLTALAAAIALAAPFPGLAATITFDGLPAAAYAGHTEEGFTVTATGLWEGFILGNPLYSVLGEGASASLLVSGPGGGEFLWESIDLNWFAPGGGGYGAEVGAPPGSGPYDFQITGLRSGATVLSLTGGVSNSGFFETILNPDPGVVLDSLSFTFTAVYASDYHIDNIVLATPVPEPGTAICLAVGLLILGARRRRA